MTDLEAAARRILELARAVSAGTNAIACERRIRDLNDFITQEDLIPCLAADWLRLKEVEKAARALIDAPGGQFLLEQDPDVGVMADPEARALESALAALDQHRKETE